MLPRDDSVLDITNDVSISAEELANRVAGQLGSNRLGVTRVEPPLSPGAGSLSQGLIREPTRKRKVPDTNLMRKGEPEKRKNREIPETTAEDEQEEQRNSKDFPKEERPEMFQDDKKFDKLSYESAARICWEFKQLSDKKEMKAKKSASLEKTDDKLPLIKIKADEDDARKVFSKARQVLRPPVVKMKNIMGWYNTKWDQIIRNLPLDIYALDDNVNSKSIELCHNL